MSNRGERFVLSLLATALIGGFATYVGMEPDWMVGGLLAATIATLR